MTTEDEVMRLLRRADPDRGRAHAPSDDGTEYLAALHTRSTTVTLTDTEPSPTQPEGRHRRPIIAAAAAAVVAIGVGGLVIATRDDDPTPQASANQPTTVASPSTVAALQVSQPPMEFTACTLAGPQVHDPTVERTVVPLPDGEMTIVRSRGVTWRQSLRDVSDPRLEGTVYFADNSDDYTLPGNGGGPSFGANTYRIENDEGAWQGSALNLYFPDGTGVTGPYVMVGEGAYEGLTAIFTWLDDVHCMRGYIIEGTIPAPAVPQTGD